MKKYHIQLCASYGVDNTKGTQLQQYEALVDSMKSRMTWLEQHVGSRTKPNELLAIHEVVMNPMDVKVNKNDTFTLKLVKEFILRAVHKEQIK